jgi:hypothetical protein
MRFGAYETAPQRVHTATGLGLVLPLALLSCSSGTAFRSGWFSFGHEWVGGGGNSLSFTGVLGQSNGQESHTYRNRSGKTCLFSSDIGPHPAYWATQPKASRLLPILRQQTAHPAIADAAMSLFGTPALARIGAPPRRFPACNLNFQIDPELARLSWQLLTQRSPVPVS